jgi:PAS domain S-box-containing protein
MENGIYRQLFDGMPCYVTAQGRDLKLLAANSLFKEDFGDGVGRYCYEVYKCRTEKCEVCPVEKTFADGRVHRSEEVIRRRGGEEVSVIVYAAPIYDADGNIIAAVEASTDITEVKQLQEQFRTLFDQVPCYISVQDRDLRLVQANQRFKTNFGDSTGARCYEVYKHRSEPCDICPVAETLHDGEIHESEEVVTTQDGRRENVLVRTAPLHDAHGNISAVMEMSTNITELRQLQDRLTSLGLLVGSVSHGIKGLLSGLDGGIYLMQTGFKKEKPERVTQGFEIVQRNVDRIRSMVMNVLYYAKDREIFWQEIDLEEITSSVETTLKSRAKVLNVGLDVACGPGTFEGDHNAVHSMLVNLLENSIDACRLDKAGKSHRVSMRARTDGDDVVIEISDNGIGMDRETREKAFSLFFSSKGAEGTGLGLFIAHRIVGSHGGTIELESKPGEGTRFVVRLPRRHAARRAVQPAPIAPVVDGPTFE